MVVDDVVKREYILSLVYIKQIIYLHIKLDTFIVITQ